jgi:hypothetical protein
MTIFHLARDQPFIETKGKTLGREGMAQTSHSSLGTSSTKLHLSIMMAHLRLN